MERAFVPIKFHFLIKLLSLVLSRDSTKRLLIEGKKRRKRGPYLTLFTNSMPTWLKLELSSKLRKLQLYSAIKLTIV